MNKDSWYIIHIDRELGGFIRSPEGFRNIYKFTPDVLQGICVYYLTIIAEDWYCLDDEVKSWFITRIASSSLAIIYDMSTGGKVECIGIHNLYRSIDISRIDNLG